MNKKQKFGIVFSILVGGVGVATAGYFAGNAIKPRDKSLEQVVTERDNYKTQLEEANKSLNENRSELAVLKIEHSQTQARLATAENQKTEALAQAESYKVQVEQNNKTIEANNKTIVILNQRIANAQTSGEMKDEEIRTLKAKANNLEEINAGLKLTNDSLMNSIASINNHVIELNTQIVDLSARIQVSSSTITALNTTISQLETTIAFYQQFVEETTPEGKVLATFEFNHSIYGLQMLNSGATPSIEDPESTAYVIFNGWKVDNQDVTLSEYPITQNTTFVADITYKYDVKYTANGSTLGDPQIVTHGEYSQAPTQAPSMPGYNFLGYTLDGVTVVDTATYPITQHTTFIAKFAIQNHEVKFQVDDAQYGQSQSVPQNGFAVKPTDPTKAGHIFKGWKVGDNLVNPATYPITGNTTFIAVFEEAVTLSYMNGDKVLLAKQVAKGSTLEAYTIPASEVGDGQFMGWAEDGYNVGNYTNKVLNEDLTLRAVIYDKIVGTYDDGKIRIYINGVIFAPSFALKGSWTKTSDGQYIISDFGDNASFSNGQLHLGSNSYERTSVVEQRISGIDKNKLVYYLDGTCKSPMGTMGYYYIFEDKVYNSFFGGGCNLSDITLD